MTTFGERLVELRNRAGFKKQGDFAAALGLPQSSVSAWETGKHDVPDVTNLFKIAKVLHCSLDDLLEGVDPDYDRADQPRHTGTEPSIEAERAPDFDITSGYRVDDLPVIAEGEASPTGSIFWDSEGRLLSSITERISRPAGLNDPRAYAVKVRGDSMVPVFRPGHYVVCSPKAPVSDGDEVYVELKSGERLIKIARRVDGGWLLESANRVYEPRIVKKAEVEHIHLIVWSRRSTPGVRVVGDDGRRK